MAVINNYVNANLSATPKTLGAAAQVSGVPVYEAIQSFVIGSSDSAGSIYRVFKGIPADAIITSFEVMNDAVAGVTGGLIGLYNVLDWDNVGAIIGSGNQLSAGFNFSSANAVASGFVNALTAPSIANRMQALWQLAAQTQAPVAAGAGQTGPKAAAFDICLTMPSMTTNTANIVCKMKWVRSN